MPRPSHLVLKAGVRQPPPHIIATPRIDTTTTTTTNNTAMAAERRGQGPLNIDLPNPSTAPPISALFLIYFDIKAGYTIGWKRSLPGVELEGVVEYKSLPSGLHTVKEDLIYFVHDGHAGLSAYVNAPASEEDRNARMIAVGVMVPLSYGRLGRAWKHAEALKEMARYVE